MRASASTSYLSSLDVVNDDPFFHHPFRFEPSSLNFLHHPNADYNQHSPNCYHNSYDGDIEAVERVQSWGLERVGSREDDNKPRYMLVAFVRLFGDAVGQQ